jgi:hypothetical protein
MACSRAEKSAMLFRQTREPASFSNAILVIAFGLKVDSSFQPLPARVGQVIIDCVILCKRRIAAEKSSFVFLIQPGVAQRVQIPKVMVWIDYCH